MRTLAGMMIVVVLGLAGCALPVPGLERTYRMALDDAFTPAERAQIQSGLDAWREASHGKMRVELVPEGVAADGAVYRGPSDVPYHRPTMEAWIDADGLRDDPAGIRAVTMHIEGRLYGIPYVRDARAVMNYDDIADDLTELDIEACRSAQVCP